MTPRQKKSSPKIRLEPHKDAISLTKKDVVKRELTEAIRMHLADRDPVAIHVLISAAAAILHAVGAANGHYTTRTRYLDLVLDEYRETVERSLDEPYNFMKHGTKDPLSTLETFNPNINEVALFMACYDYANVYNETFFEMNLYSAYIVETKPNFLKGEDAHWTAILVAAKGLAGTETLDRAAAHRAIEAADKLVRDGHASL